MGPVPLLAQKSALIVINSGHNDDLSGALVTADPERWSRVHSLALQGCTGTLALPDIGEESVLSVLWRDFLSPRSMEEFQLPKRFGGWTPLVVCNSKSIAVVSREYGCTTLYHEELSSDVVSSIFQQQLSGPQGQLVVIVLDHPIHEKTRTIESVLDWLEMILTRAGPLLDDVLVTVVLALEGLYSTQNPLKMGQTLIDTGGSPEDFPSIHRPRQSFEVSEYQLGSSCTPQPEQLSTTAGALTIQCMAGITRRDAIAKLDPDKILDSGGSSTICAHHLLKELAFKLGHSPKYGA